MRFLILSVFLIAVLGCSKPAPVEEKESAPDFTLSSIDGKSLSLKDYRDKKTVLAVFWATWCPFCVEEIPILNKMADEYSDKIEVLGINIKEKPEKVSSFSKTKRIKYTILLDPDGKTAQEYKVLGIPTNVLIDSDGKILYKGHSIEECESRLRGEIRKGG